MKAVMVEKFAPVGEGAVYRETPDPAPAEGEVVIEVAFAEANFPDILVVEGNYQVKPPLPFSPGKAAVGTVTALGPGVTAPAIGTRVSANVEYGAYAAKMVAKAGNCSPIPDAMPFETAQALGGLIYQTAHFALVDRARIQKGDRVLVLGATGGVGSAACQLAKALGAATVIGGVRDASAIDGARALGCDHVIDLSAGDLREHLRAEVKAATNGHGADIVIDPLGGDAFTAALRALAWRGRLVVVGFAAGGIPEMRVNYLLLKNIEVSGLQWSDYRDRDPDWVERVQQEIFALWAEGKLDPPVAETLPLSRFAEALGKLKSGGVRGRILLKPEP